MTEYKKGIAGWLKENLTKKGYDYRKLAKEIDVSPPTILRWLNGTQFPRPDKFKRIANIVTDDIKSATIFKNAQFNEKLFLLRNFEGLSIVEMSKGVMVNDGLIRRWENNQTKPDDNQMRRLLQYFDIQPEDLNIDIAITSFGSRLQEERKALEMTQAEVANKIGRTPTLISDFENEKRVPNESDIKKLAKLFKVSVNSLIIDEEGLPYEAFAILYVKQIREGKIPAHSH